MCACACWEIVVTERNNVKNVCESVSVVRRVIHTGVLVAQTHFTDFTHFKLSPMEWNTIRKCVALTLSHVSNYVTQMITFKYKHLMQRICDSLGFILLKKKYININDY